VTRVNHVQVIRLLEIICGAVPGTVPVLFRIMVHSLFDYYRPNLENETYAKAKLFNTT